MAAIRRRKLEGVLLDVDGTLVDSNDAHARSWSEALRHFGRVVPAEDIRPLIGMGGDKLIPRLLGVDAGSAEGKRFSDWRGRLFQEKYVPSLRATPGSPELVRRLEREGYRLVIATSANEAELAAILCQVGLAHLSQQKTSSSDVEESKPDPDIIHAALARGDLKPGATLMLGDTPYDVEAARRAGVDTVALLCGGWNADALDGAIAIYEDPAAVLRDFSASPFSFVARDPGK